MQSSARTGGTGRQVVAQALAAGHQVRALVRELAKLAIQHDDLTIIPGNVLDTDQVERTVSGTDAVIISLGSTPDNPAMICTEGTRVVIECLERLGTPRRLLVVTSLGVGDSRDQVSLTFKMLLKTALRQVFQDKEQQEALVKASDLDWTIVRPGGSAMVRPPVSTAMAWTPTSWLARWLGPMWLRLLKQLEDDTFLRNTGHNLMKRLRSIDRRLLTILLIVFVQMVGAAMIMPILPLYAQREFDMSPQFITLLGTAFFAAQFIAGPFLGRASDELAACRC